MPWMIAELHHTSRAHFYGGGTTITEWFPKERYGRHETNVAAKRAYVVAMEPVLADASDDYIRRWFNGTPRQCGLVKIVRAP